MQTDILQLSNIFFRLTINTKNIIKIQKWFRGSIIRLKQLPLIILQIQKYLKTVNFIFSKTNEDGRINSCLDEDEIIKKISEKYINKIKKPNIRMWYDILVFDNIYGWLPVNLKTTTTLTCDNIGNLATCVYAYTDEKLDLQQIKTYENGVMSKLLIEKIKNNKYNLNSKKDYYFIVLNKNNNSDVIVNSIKGLSILAPNSNNLPFQVCWNKNRVFNYENINKKIKLFVKCIQSQKISWKETFVQDIKQLNV